MSDDRWIDKKFIPENFQQCSLTVMDNIQDPNISFDEKGVCNYYYEFQDLKKQLPWLSDAELQKQKYTATINSLKNSGKKYDCVLGVSGGVDSTYLAYLLAKEGVNTLLVHFDNGWNSELSVQNIQNIVEKTGFDLETFVMDWEEFRDLQRSYFEASVLDLEVPTDHMIFGSIYKIANSYGLKNIISGNNMVTEWLLPKAWYYPKFDLVNLVNIQKKFGTLPLKKLPKLGVWQHAYFQLVKGIENIKILDLVDYDKAQAKATIKSELDWIDYGGKHYESIFTRFYQGYILPKKFGIDKRKAHLSNLILSGQMTKEEALVELSKPPMEESLAKADFEYVAKKLGYTNEEFQKILELPNIDHSVYGNDHHERKKYFKMMKMLKPISRLLK